jgi:hypothetical protein
MTLQLFFAACLVYLESVLESMKANSIYWSLFDRITAWKIFSRHQKVTKSKHKVGYDKISYSYVGFYVFQNILSNYWFFVVL